MKFLLLSCPILVFALPIDMRLIDGDASVSIESSKMEIAVSDTAILHWSDFSIAPDESVQFFQPSETSCVLNKITGQNPSQILGALKSNGECILINPNGVIFGKESRIDVHSLIASTFDLHDLKNRHFSSVGSDLFCSGTIIAKGHVYLLGERVGLFDNAAIMAPSGTVLIGGDFQGKNPNIPNAEMVYFSSTATISVDAAERGNGGTIVLWANTLNQSHGSLFSRGGTIEGHGGLIEVSSHNILEFTGKVNLLAPFGHAGTFLLDPLDLTIDPAAGADAFVPLVSPFIPTGGVCAPGPGNAILTTATLATALTGGNVIIQTTGTSGACPGDIIWLEDVALFSYAETNSLTFDAANNVVIQTDVDNTLAGDIIINAGGGVFLTANNRRATLTTLGNIDVASVTGFTATGGIADPSDAGLDAGGTLSIDITNGDLFLTGGSTAINPASTLAFLNSTGPMTIDIASGNILLLGGTAPGPSADSTASITSASSIDINLLNGSVTLQTGPGSPANAGISAAAGALTLDIMNGNLLLDSTTSQDNTSLAGAPILISVPQGAIDVLANNSGTTGINFNGDSYMNLVARDSITFFSGTSARNQNGGIAPSGQPSLIESLTGDIIIDRPSGQRLFFNSNFPLTFRAARDIIVNSSGPGLTTLTTGSFFLTMDAVRDVTWFSDGPIIHFIQGLFGLVINAGRDILLQQTSSGIISFPFVGAGGISFNAGGFFNADQNGTLFDMFMNTSGPFSIVSGASSNFFVNGPMNIIFSAAEDFDIRAGANISYSSTSSGLVQTHGSLGFTMDAGANINLFDNAQVTTDGTSILMIADINIRMNPTSLIDMVMPLVPGSTVTLVVDDAFPARPLIGPGAFIMSNGAQIMTTERPPIAIYTAQQSLNLIAGLINGSAFSAGTLFVDTDSERWCIYYPDGLNVVPFRVHYKNCLQQVVAQAALIIDGNLPTALHPYNEFPGWWNQYKIIYYDGRFEPYFITHRYLKVFDLPKSYTAWLHDTIDD